MLLVDDHPSIETGDEAPPDGVLESVGGDTQHRVVQTGERGLGEILFRRGRADREDVVANRGIETLEDTLLPSVEDQLPRPRFHGIARRGQPCPPLASHGIRREATHLTPFI